MNAMRKMIEFSVFFIVFLSIVSGNTETSLSEQIRNVKASILGYIASNPQLVYPKDDNLEIEDWFIQRYLLDNQRNEKHAENALINSLNFWRREKILEYNETYFPAEFYATGFMYIFGKSSLNQTVLGSVTRCLHPISRISVSSSHLYDLTLKYLLFIQRKVLFESNKKNFVMLNVMTNSTLENSEISLIKSFMQLMRKHSPGSPSKNFMLGLNPLVKSTFKFFFRLLNSNNMKYIDFEEIEEWISLDEIPVHSGGNNMNFERIPEGVKSGKCLPHLEHILPEEWDTFRDANIDCIREGMLESGMSSMDKYLRYC